MKKCSREDCAEYPYYGVAPHTHDMKKTGSIIGSTVIEPEETWPDNFIPDRDSESCGTYLCPECKSENQ